MRKWCMCGPLIWFNGSIIIRIKPQLSALFLLSETNTQWHIVDTGRTQCTRIYLNVYAYHSYFKLSMMLKLWLKILIANHTWVFCFAKLNKAIEKWVRHFNKFSLGSQVSIPGLSYSDSTKYPKYDTSKTYNVVALQPHCQNTTRSDNQLAYNSVTIMTIDSPVLLPACTGSSRLTMSVWKAWARFLWRRQVNKKQFLITIFPGFCFQCYIAINSELSVPSLFIDKRTSFKFIYFYLLMLV